MVLVSVDGVGFVGWGIEKVHDWFRWAGGSL